MDLLTTIMICGMYYTNSVTNAMIQIGSKANPLTVTVVAPASTAGAAASNNVALVKSDFKTREEAADFVRQQIAQGHHVDIGMMQIPSAWLDKLTAQGVLLKDLFLPCKNVAVATDLLNQSEAYCATITDNVAEREKCALSFYWTGNPKAGLSYANQVIKYAEKHPVEANPLEQKVNFNQLTDSSYELPAPTFKKASASDQQTSVEDQDQNDGTIDSSAAKANDSTNSPDDHGTALNDQNNSVTQDNKVLGESNDNSSN